MNLRGHLPFLFEGYATIAHVVALVVLTPEPRSGNLMHVVNCFEVVEVQPFVPDSPVIAFDLGVLLRLSGHDVAQGDAPVFRRLRERGADNFLAIVDLNCAKLVTPCNSMVQRPDCTLGGK